MEMEKRDGRWQRLKERWWTRRTRRLLAATLLLAVLALAGALLACRIVRRGWPQTAGTVLVAGLRAPVTVVRDRLGIPHLYAETEADLFFAQGYVHAQDRFWGMELARRRGRGTLAQLLGETAQEADAAWRALDLADVARNELAKLEGAASEALAAYVAGVNAWLGQERQRLPFAFTVLEWRRSEVPEPTAWTAEDSLIVALVFTWQVGGPSLDPSLAIQIEDRVGPEGAALLLGEGGGDVLGWPVDAPGPALSGLSNNLPARWALGGRVTRVSGDDTPSGKPLLALDLPSGLELPTPWYVLTWHVNDDAAMGASLPGLPGLVVGTDDTSAWVLWSPGHGAPASEGLPPWRRWLLTALFSPAQIVELTEQPAAQNPEQLQALLTDTSSARAARLVPKLLQVQPQGWRQERVTGMLRQWGYHIGDNNKEAPFFVVYQLELARAAFADEMSPALFEAYAAQSERYQIALDEILDHPDDAWWDDVTTPEQETREEILERAYEPALEWIGRNYGDLHMLWEWDVVHGSRLHHALGDAWPWDQLLSLDLNPDGWADTANASPGGLPCVGGMCMGGDLFRAKAVYAYRQILDASDLSTLWFALLPGQSDRPFHPHYNDLMDEWLAGEYVPLRLSAIPEAVQGAESALILEPGASAQ
jgi:acyl-homoserine lactone acylase PvdQ